MDVIDPRGGTANAIEAIDQWIKDPNSHLLRIPLRNLTFANHLREIERMSRCGRTERPAGLIASIGVVTMLKVARL